MRKIFITTLLSTVLLAGHAFSVEQDTGFYAGLKLSRLNLDVNGISDGTTTGLIGGYRLSDTRSIELDYASYGVEVLGYDTDIDTTAIYAAFRSDSSPYFKAKVGFLNEKIVGNAFDFNESDSGMSYGLGVGFQGENILAELEYTIVEEDASSVSLNLMYKF